MSAGHLNDEIRRLQKIQALGLTQAELARAIGVSQQRVSQLLAVAKDSRITNIVSNSLPRDTLTIYLLTSLPDEDFVRHVGRQRSCGMPNASSSSASRAQRFVIRIIDTLENSANQ